MGQERVRSKESSHSGLVVETRNFVPPSAIVSSGIHKMYACFFFLFLMSFLSLCNRSAALLAEEYRAKKREKTLRSIPI